MDAHLVAWMAGQKALLHVVQEMKLVVMLVTAWVVEMVERKAHSMALQWVVRMVVLTAPRLVGVSEVHQVDV